MTSFYVIGLTCIIALILYRHAYNRGRMDQRRDDRELFGLLRPTNTNDFHRAVARALTLDCSNPRHSTHLIQGHPLAPVSFNVGSADKNIAEAQRNGWRRTATGWQCPVCASTAFDK